MGTRVGKFKNMKLHGFTPVVSFFCFWAKWKSAQSSKDFRISVLRSSATAQRRASTYDSGFLRRRIKNTSFVIPLFTILFGLISVFIISSSSQKQQGVPSVAKEAELIQNVKSELKEKPLSSICAQNNAQVISAFSNCPQDRQRLSQNPDNPLFYCCR